MAPRTEKRLTVLSLRNISKPGLYADGGGLYLQITKAGVRSWLFRYMRNGKARGMGLGPCRDVSLSEARDKASTCKKQLRDGIDPLDEKVNTARAALISKTETPSCPTFRECAIAHIDAHKAGWKSEKHAAQWLSTLTTYAFPIIGEHLVAEVDTTAILKIIEPIWVEKTETASRLRGRIESILDSAKVRGYRSGENPARLKGHLDRLLPKQSKVSEVTHFAALHYSEIATFMKTLRNQNSMAAYALELLILSACRTNEVINATWHEVDLDGGLWIIPAERMKARREHRIPLSQPATILFRKLEAIRQNDYVFPGQRQGKPLSNMAMLQLLKRMDRTDLTAHGFRSTFRDWAAECTHHPREIAEAALAHTLKDKTEAAYQRGDLLEKRSRMMQDWANFCAGI